MLAAVGRQWGGSPGKSSAHLFICRPGWLQDDICIPFRCGSLPRPARSRCCFCTRAAQPCAVPAVGPCTVTSWAGAEPRTRSASFTKGQTQAETLMQPGKGRSFPALPKCHISAALPIWCLVQRSLPRWLPLHSRAPGVSSDCRTLQTGCPAQHHSLWQPHAVLKLESLLFFWFIPLPSSSLTSV